MKTIVYLACITFVVFTTNHTISFGQATTDTIKYKLSTKKESYQSLSNYTSITNGKVWYDEGFTLPLPFPVYIMDSRVDTLYGANFYMDDLGTNQSGYCPKDTFGLFIFFDFGAIDRGNGTSTSQSDIRYSTEGLQGNRVFKIEWFNIGDALEYETIGTTNSYANFQLWLFEGSNIVEFRFGNISFGDTSFVCGSPRLSFGKCKGQDFDIQTINYYLQGNPNNPILKYNNDPSKAYCMDSLPPSGIVYSFTPEKSVSIKNTYSEKLLISPNPAHSEIHIKSNDQSPIQLYDVRGSLIKVWDANAIKDVSDLPTGMYIVVQGNKRAKFSKN